MSILGTAATGSAAMAVPGGKLLGAGYLYNKAIGQGPDPASEIGGIDQRYKDSVSEQSGAASQFRNNLGNYQQGRFNVASDQGRRGLANTMANTRSQYSSRGLLYGGLQQGAQAGNQSALASSLAGQRNQINSDSEDQARQYELAAIQQGQSLRDLEQQRNEAIYNAQQQNAQANKGLLGGISGLAGGLLGGAGK